MKETSNNQSISSVPKIQKLRKSNSAACLLICDTTSHFILCVFFCFWCVISTATQSKAACCIMGNRAARGKRRSIIFLGHVSDSCSCSEQTHILRDMWLADVALGVFAKVGWVQRDRRSGGRGGDEEEKEGNGHQICSRAALLQPWKAAGSLRFQVQSLTDLFRKAPISRFKYDRTNRRPLRRKRLPGYCKTFLTWHTYKSIWWRANRKCLESEPRLGRWLANLPSITFKRSNRICDC